MPSSEELLEQFAAGGSIASDHWPQVRDYVTERINAITVTEFPPYQSPLESIKSSKRSPTLKNADSVATQDSEITDKENAPPVVSSSTQLDFFGQPKQQISPLDMCKSLHSEILESLKQFPEHPPHTIQRLAELVLWPTREYRFLPPYLHAVSRAISVSSNTSVFPLSFHQSAPQTGPLGLVANGEVDSMLGSDESLGGALLTPIPWLTGDSASPNVDRDLQETAQRLQDQQALHASEQNGTLVNGETPVLSSSSADEQEAAKSTSLEAELRGEGAVTQGELLRLEQEAGIVSVGHRAAQDVTAERIDGEGATLNKEDSDEIPHARGPEEIGVEDTGPPTGTGGVAGLMEASAAKSVSQEETGAESEDGTKMDVDESTGDKAN